MVLHIENWLSVSDFGCFWQLCATVSIHKIQYFYLRMLIFSKKSIFPLKTSQPILPYWTHSNLSWFIRWHSTFEQPPTPWLKHYGRFGQIWIWSKYHYKLWISYNFFLLLNPKCDRYCTHDCTWPIRHWKIFIDHN